MTAARLFLSCGVAATLLAATGCFAPVSRVNALKAQNQALSERNRALDVNLENLAIHGRNTEDKLARAEQDLALLEERLGLDAGRLANFRLERDQLHDHLQGMFDSRSSLSAQAQARLNEISDRYDRLDFDLRLGVAKLSTDVLFGAGEAELQPGAEELLRELAGVLNRPETRDLKVLVVGHTDDRLVARRPARDLFTDNFDLSTARANAVGSVLRELGLSEERIGEVGFGPHQPVAPNVSTADRRKNRRVEIFVMAPDVPVIGWTESTPNLY